MRRLLLLGLGGTVALVGQSYFSRRLAVNDAILLMVWAGLAVAVAVGASAWPDSPPVPRSGFSPSQSDAARRQGRWVLLASLALALAASIAAAGNWARSAVDSALLIVIASLLAAFGFSRLEGWRFGDEMRAALGTAAREKGEVAALAAIVLFAAWFRLWQLDYYPPLNGVGFIDEAQFGKMALDILEGQRPWMFASSLYPAALFFKLFGMSMLVLRLPFVVSGIIAVLVFYFLARPLTGRGAALAAALLFAASRWHVTFSRAILPVNMEALIGLLAFVFLYRAWRTGGGMSFVLAGAFTTLGLYGYAGYRVVPVIAVALLILHLAGRLWGFVRARSGDERAAARCALRRDLQGTALYLIGAIIILIPFLGIVARDPVNAFTERFTSVMPVVTADDKLTVLRGLGETLRDALLLFNYRGDASPMFNIPGAPNLDPISGLFFAVGLVASLLYVWKGHSSLPVLWFLLTLMGGTVLTRSMQTYRIVGLAPAIFLLIAYLFAAVGNRLRMTIGSNRMPAVVVPAVALLAAACLWNANDFFNNQIHRVDVRTEYTHGMEMAGAYIAHQTDKPYVHLMASFPFYERWTDHGWLAGLPRGRKSFRWSDMLPHRDDAGPALYVFAWPYDDGEAMRMVTSFYPDAACEQGFGARGNPLWAACRVEKEAVQQLQGLQARYYRGLTTGGDPALVRRDPTLDFLWDRANMPLDEPFSAEWIGSLYVAEYGPITLGVESTSPMTVALDGRLVLDSGNRPEQTVTVAQGWHSLSARLVGATVGGVTRLYVVSSGKRQIVGSSQLSTIVEMGGATARFYAGPSWQGPVLLERRDPFLDFHAGAESAEERPSKAIPAGPFSAEWAARLTISDSGLYRFRIAAVSGQSELLIDERSIARTEMGGYDQVLQQEGEINLTAGEHLLRLRYSFREGHTARAWVYWQPPGQPMGFVPSQVLKPIASEPAR